MSHKQITVSITTRNRPEAVVRCLRSLSLAAGIIDRILLADDASDAPLSADTIAAIGSEIGVPIELLRSDTHRGTSGSRNALAERASTPYVLSLDDDAFLVEAAAVVRGLRILERDRDVAAIAFAQADEHGVPRPAWQQPGRGARATYVPAFIGFASLIRRECLLAVGGYRAIFSMHGEEREICLRWLDRGWRVVYLPDAPVAHVADPGNRDPVMYVRHVIRNDCLNALYNEPLPRAMISIPIRLRNFRRMAAGLAAGDPDGLRWIVRELWARWPEVRAGRRALRWRTFAQWKRLRGGDVLYPHA